MVTVKLDGAKLHILLSSIRGGFVWSPLLFLSLTLLHSGVFPGRIFENYRWNFWRKWIGDRSLITYIPLVNYLIVLHKLRIINRRAVRILNYYVRLLKGVLRVCDEHAFLGLSDVEWLLLNLQRGGVMLVTWVFKRWVVVREPNLFLTYFIPLLCAGLLFTGRFCIADGVRISVLFRNVRSVARRWVFDHHACALLCLVPHFGWGFITILLI